MLLIPVMTKALAGMNRPGITHMELSKLHMAGSRRPMMSKLAAGAATALLAMRKS